MSGGRALLIVLACVLPWSTAARAESANVTYQSAFAALQKGAPDEAIDRLELLADQGFSHPDASVLRAAAYLARAEGARARPGDLGRAAAGLTEALLLRPDDPQSEQVLEQVQAEIARRKSRERAEIVARPALGRALTSLLPEQVWAILAALGVLVFTLGLLARRVSARTFVRLSGAVAIGVGGVAGAGFTAGTWAARHFRTTSTPAVVVVPETRLSDDSGKPLKARAGSEDMANAPEGATVYVLERREGRCRVEWGSSQGWVSAGDLQVLAVSH